MSKFEVVEANSDPGSPHKPNEDNFGHSDRCVFVIDGATGLGGSTIVKNETSDAAWLAGNAARYFSQHLGRCEDVPNLVYQFILEVKTQFAEHAGEEKIPRYAWPSASFAMLHDAKNGIEFSALGDCCAYVEDSRGVVTKYSALEEFKQWENEQAATHIKRTGGIGTDSLLDDDETLQYLRKIRSLQNTHHSNVWTLGLVPQAADHIFQIPVAIEGASTALICSDGFDALVETYDAYSARELISAAKRNGIAALMGELRHIEREIDPRATRFPRFKTSDDATAMLVRL